MNLNRRTFLGTIAALLAATKSNMPASAQTSGQSEQVKLGEAVPFSKSALLKKVKGLAASSYKAPPQVPEPWINLTYDQYRNIRFRQSSTLWRDGKGAYEADLPVDDTLNYSGFKLGSQINDPRQRSEFMVFQGASYFRAIGKDQTYGLSARGLALNTADNDGEEFPDFRSFWIDRGTDGQKSVTVYALLDSPSVAGLYTFVITPGVSTEMEVEAVLFPRVDLDNVGIAAETSMFLFDETNRSRFDDFRPAVHDSDGLLIENGAGETLWRQLANPKSLQISSFVDTNPKGFGLMQRPRDLANFADLEAHYHKRPGLWVIPGENWGKGAVTLIEIPADREIYDNIVAYWRPRKPLAAGQEHHFSYRLLWGDTPPITKKLARVINTRMGKRFTGGRLVTIDFAPTNTLPENLSDISLHVSSNGAKVSKGILQNNPETGGVRLAFTFFPERRTSIELRAQLMANGKSASEVWLYRWTV